MILEFKNPLLTQFSRLVAMGVHDFAVQSEGIRVQYPLSEIDGQGMNPGDGIISHSVEELQRAVKMGIPCVNFCSMPVPGVPQVNCDNQAILELIFNHLRARNFRTVILLDDESSLVSEPRRANFVKLCTKHTCLPNVIGLRHLSDISLENRELVTKLEHLPKPAAIILTSDYQWSSLAAVCDSLGFRIPEDLAVVGIGNDNDTTSTGGTLLSSVDIHAQKIGFVAASVLARLIGGETVPDKTLVAPSELIVRKSSDITIHLNPNIEKAIDFLHENLHENIEVEDIVRQQNLCRRSLEMNFKAQFNQSPMQYLRAMRLEKVRNLLRTTDLSVTEIGRQCGIPDINYLCRLFRKLYHTTPLNYREQY